ncbi:sugar ABC transporter permease [Microbacterium sp. NPDC096154]|uniref:carbohydrate ABC transporter permease n=1 Tax=Microbacterium sp. NPDC096154 TaxID=3155549 RepID=UPI00332B90B4
MFVAVSAVTPREGVAAAPAPRRRGPRWSSVVPYLYLLPAVLMLVVWTYKPLVETFQLSFFDWNLIPTSPRTFVGVDNYAEVVALPELHVALANTVVYVAAFFVFSLVLPVLVGLLAGRVSGRAKAIYQGLIFVPFLVTPVATGAVWRWLFAEQGTIPAIARALGWELGNVFRDPSMAIWGVIVIVGWQMLGFGVLVVAAGFAGISPDYGHAASLDGASERQIVRRITLPLLSPSLLFIALMTILLAAQWTYPIIDLLTQGGPTGATTNIYYLLYQFGFRNFDAGLSAAAGVIFFVAFGLIALLFLRLQDRLSFYDN